MRRREFITLLGGTAAAWPLTARAQQSAMPMIGFLHSASPATFARLVAAFRKGLRETGYVEGENIAIEQRWAEGQYERLPALADDLVQRRVAVIATMGGDGPARAAMAATSTIPVTFVLGSDPVQLGLVASLSRPGGNVTGIVQFTTALEGKRLDLLHQIMPTANLIAVLVNPTRSIADAQRAEIEDAASRLGIKVAILTAKNGSELEMAFVTITAQRMGALLVAADPFFFSRRQQLVELAARHKVAAMYEFRDFPDSGGLMSYGTDLANAYRENGVYVGRILRGAKPSDLPVMQSTRFEFVINLKAAEALEVPLHFQQLADEVIE